MAKSAFKISLTAVVKCGTGVPLKRECDSLEYLAVLSPQYITISGHKVMSIIQITIIFCHFNMFLAYNLIRKFEQPDQKFAMCAEDYSVKQLLLARSC